MCPGKMFRVVKRADQPGLRGAIPHLQIDRVGARRVAQREQGAADEMAGDRRGRISAVRLRHDLAAGKKPVACRRRTGLHRQVELRLVARHDYGGGAVIDDQVTELGGMGLRMFVERYATCSCCADQEVRAP